MLSVRVLRSLPALCRVRAVEMAKISGPIDHARSSDNNEPSDINQNTRVSAAEENAWNQSISVLLSKPILALEFNLLKMQVEAPTVMVPRSNKPEVGNGRSRFRPFFFW